MLSGHRPARRRPRDRRAARIAAPLGVPMALGLTLGIVLALSGGNGTKIDQSSLGASPKPSQAPAVSAQPQASSGAGSSARRRTHHSPERTRPTAGACPDLRG